ncbi:MAG: hypothetical protein LW819_07395, partial [Fimbriimonadaceae bacterium]|nr:hypothetical protein [Fimbriimonadaceae bacterium]
MTAKSPNLGTWISGVLLLGAWIFQDYFGSESQSLESEINRFEVALSLLDISDQLTDTQDFVGDLLEVSVEN